MEDKRVVAAAALLAGTGGVLTVPKAMLAEGFTADESKQVRLQMLVRRARDEQKSSNDVDDDDDSNSFTLRLRNGLDSMLAIYKLAMHSKESTELYEDIHKSGAFPKIIEKETETLINNMTEHLKQRCGKFDYKSFANQLVESVLSRPHQSTSKTPFVVAGQTQTGKSSVPGVVQAMCSRMNFPLIVITKGVPESRELCYKLQEFARGAQAERYIVSSCANVGGKRVHWVHKRQEIKDALENGGTIVVADTAAQIKKVTEAIHTYRGDDEQKYFAVVVDECDAMLRTHDRRQKMEQAYDYLVALKPLLTVLISATPIPVMLQIVWDAEENGQAPVQNIPFIELEPSDDYMGINEMKPLEDKDGSELYLELNELSYSTPIPYFNEKVEQLYNDALINGSKKKGVLVLDCTSPRVWAPGNVRVKAKKVQRFYKKKGTDIVVITYIGRGIYVRKPNGAWEFKEGCRISEVLDEIDKDASLGLEIPIIVFGFSKMRRGISYRSERRVPTHYVMLLGRFHKAMNVIQVMGRGTFNGRNILEENGFDYVKILSTSSDFEMAQTYLKYVKEIGKRIESGESFQDALFGAKTMLPDNANFMRHTSREIGQLKGQRRRFEDDSQFEEPEEKLGRDDLHFKKTNWNIEIAQGIFRTVLELSQKDEAAMELMDTTDAYNDTFQGYRPRINKTQANRYIRALLDRSMLQKTESANIFRRSGGFKVKYHIRLRMCINPVHAMTKKEIEEKWDFDELIGRVSEHIDDDDESQVSWVDGDESQVSSLPSSRTSISLTVPGTVSQSESSEVASPVTYAGTDEEKAEVTPNPPRTRKGPKTKSSSTDRIGGSPKRRRQKRILSKRKKTETNSSRTDSSDGGSPKRRRQGRKCLV